MPTQNEKEWQNMTNVKSLKFKVDKTYRNNGKWLPHVNKVILKMLGGEMD